MTGEAVVAAQSVRAPADSPLRLAWRRFRRDRVGLAAAIVVAVVLVAAIGADLICRLAGVDLARHVELLSLDNVGFPDGAFGGASVDHPLGIEPKTGRDLLALVLYGGRNSLIIALGSTALALMLASTVGLVAGFFGGWVDGVLCRLMDCIMAFPVLLFSIGLLVVLGGVDRIGPLSGLGLRITILTGIIGVFAFPYGGRLIRAAVLSLRNRDFVVAAAALGASRRDLLILEILPNLAGPMIVLASTMIPTFILTEAGLSFLGVGVQAPDTSWGQLLGSASHVFTVTPTYMLFPGLAMVITVLAFNLLGDAIRDAFDTRM